MVRKERVLVIVAAIAVLVYARYVYTHQSYACGGPDSGGYMNEAKLIASGHITEPVELVRVLGLDDSWLGYFMPLGFAPSKGGSMHPLYPPGLPMHLAAAGRIGGWKKAPYLVAPIAAVGCVILMIVVATRLGVPLILSFAGAFAVGMLPPFLWHAVQPASDVVAMFWALLAVWFALREWGVAAGIAFAIGVWVRPTNALMLIPLALAVRVQWRALVAIAAGAAPLVAALMVWNAKLYGSPFRTGYGEISMTWAGATTAGPQHALWLLLFLTPVVFPCGLLVLFDRKVDMWTRWMLFSWFVAYFVFYSFYGFWDGWLCIRFLLPAIPALLFGTFLLMRDLAQGRRVTIAIAAALAIWIAAEPVIYGRKLDVLRTLRTAETAYPQYIAFSERHVPKRAIVMTGVLCGAYLFYENRSIVRYDQLNDDRFQTLRAYSGIHGLPWYAVVSDDELTPDQLRQRFRGDWELIDHFASVAIYRLRD